MYYEFGERLKGLRTGFPMTQQRLADEIGVTKSVVSAYETSSRYPSYPILLRIAEVFGVSTDYLLGRDTGRVLDVSALSEENLQLVAQLVQALARKE